jgi:hypothetical protein
LRSWQPQKFAHGDRGGADTGDDADDDGGGEDHGSLQLPAAESGRPAPEVALACESPAGLRAGTLGGELVDVGSRRELFLGLGMPGVGEQVHVCSRGECRGGQATEQKQRECQATAEPTASRAIIFAQKLFRGDPMGRGIDRSQYFPQLHTTLAAT